MQRRPVEPNSRPVGSGAAWRRSPHQKSAGIKGREGRKEREKTRKKRERRKKERKGEEIKREICITPMWV